MTVISSGNLTPSAGRVAFDSTVDSAPGFPNSGLTVNAGFIILTGALGATSPLGAVSLTSSVANLSLPLITATGNITLSATTVLNGDITTSGGGIVFADPVFLQANVALNAPSGAVTFDSTIDTGGTTTCGGAGCDLTVSGSAISFGGV